MTKSKVWITVLKKCLIIAFFLLVMILTFHTVFTSEEDPTKLWTNLTKIHPGYVILMFVSAILFELLEAYKIQIVMGIRGIRGFLRCVGYALIEFFYSGITPSASGGQPMQLVYMKQDGCSFTKSCAGLTLIAAAKKMVLLILGLVLILFWRGPLQAAFEDYLFWFYLGWGIIVIWTGLLIAFMFSPNLCEKVLLGAFRLVNRFLKHKKAEKVEEGIHAFFDAYRDIVLLIREHPAMVLYMVVLSFLQRFFLVVITVWVYKGLGLNETGAVTVFFLQLAVMVSVDMIPVPGAQGISEYIYHKVSVGVFGETYLTASMLASRAVNFYFLLLLGLLMVIVWKFVRRKLHEPEPETSVD